MARWDLFCRVVDNYGDVGVCWRLSRQLTGEYGAEVRLWVDNLLAFQRLCPSIELDLPRQQVCQIEVCHWPTEFPEVEAADVVIEAFACELPANYLAAMARRAVAPVWINLEYLTAEAWVDECHLLTSPSAHLKLTKHFFFPGFTPQTGGLLREGDLLKQRAAFDARARAEFWHDMGLPPPAAGELRVSLFCYDNPALPELLECWAEGPEEICLLASPGRAIEQVQDWFGQPLALGKPLRTGCLTAWALPFVPQSTYDRLLWACDVNFVRGEDSFLRAQWAQRPFVWQIYPQAERAHLVKLEAFLSRYLDGFPQPEAVLGLWRAWNGAEKPTSSEPWTVENIPGGIRSAWREYIANRRCIQQHGEVWAVRLDRAGNLANNLDCFARSN